MMKINRRTFLSNTLIPAAGLIISSSSNASCIKEKRVYPAFNIMREALKYRKIDSHIHAYLSPEDDNRSLIDYADRLGIEKMVISLPVTTMDAPHEEYVRSNDLMLKAMKEFPGRFIAQFTLNPFYAKQSLEEIDRCTGKGMIGLKVYYQHKLNEPVFYPVIERMIGLKMIILMHSYSGLGRGSYMTKYGNLFPNESTPEDFVEVAQRYPEALLQFAHLGAGGDWTYECKVLKDYPNVFFDLSGSNNEENMVNYAIKTVGEDRLFFGSDNSYYQGVSTILAADITEDQRRKLFFENYNNILKRGGYNVD